IWASHEFVGRASARVALCFPTARFGWTDHERSSKDSGSGGCNSEGPCVTGAREAQATDERGARCRDSFNLDPKCFAGCGEEVATRIRFTKFRWSAALRTTGCYDLTARG